MIERRELLSDADGVPICPYCLVKAETCGGAFAINHEAFCDDPIWDDDDDD